MSIDQANSTIEKPPSLKLHCASSPLTPEEMRFTENLFEVFLNVSGNFDFEDFVKKTRLQLEAISPSQFSPLHKLHLMFVIWDRASALDNNQRERQTLARTIISQVRYVLLIIYQQRAAQLLQEPEIDAFLARLGLHLFALDDFPMLSDNWSARMGPVRNINGFFSVAFAIRVWHGMENRMVMPGRSTFQQYLNQASCLMMRQECFVLLGISPHIFPTAQELINMIRIFEQNEALEVLHSAFVRHRNHFVQPNFTPLQYYLAVLSAHRVKERLEDFPESDPKILQLSDLSVVFMEIFSMIISVLRDTLTKIRAQQTTTGDSLAEVMDTITRRLMVHEQIKPMNGLEYAIRKACWLFIRGFLIGNHVLSIYFNAAAVRTIPEIVDSYSHAFPCASWPRLFENLCEIMSMKKTPIPDIYYATLDHLSLLLVRRNGGTLGLPLFADIQPQFVQAIRLVAVRMSSQAAGADVEDVKEEKETPSQRESSNSLAKETSPVLLLLQQQQQEFQVLQRSLQQQQVERVESPNQSKSAAAPVTPPRRCHPAASPITPPSRTQSPDVHHRHQFSGNPPFGGFGLYGPESGGRLSNVATAALQQSLDDVPPRRMAVAAAAEIASRRDGGFDLPRPAAVRVPRANLDRVWNSRTVAASQMMGGDSDERKTFPGPRDQPAQNFYAYRNAMSASQCAASQGRRPGAWGAVNTLHPPF